MPQCAGDAQFEVEDLDFRGFLSILSEDHGFDAKRDQLAWDENSTLDTDRSWKAVLGSMRLHNQPFDFYVLPRASDEDGALSNHAAR